MKVRDGEAGFGEIADHESRTRPAAGRVAAQNKVIRPKEQGEMHRVHERKETALIRGDLLEMTAGPGNRRRWVPVNVHESADAVIGRSGSPIEGPNGKKG